MNRTARDSQGQLHLALVTANPIRTGGMQRFSRFVIEAACSAHWRVTVALSGDDIYRDMVPSVRGRLAVEAVDWVDRNYTGDRHYRYLAIMDRRHWFRRVKPDVALFVQSSNTPFRASIVGAWLAQVPIVTTHRTMPWIKDFVPPGRHFFGLIRGLGLHNWRQITRTRLTAALAGRVVYNSVCVRACYERQYRYPARKGRVIANATAAPPSAVGERTPSDALTIGYVGRLADEKRIDLLVRAVASLPTHRSIRLLICGEGPEREPLERLATDLGIADRIEWAGQVDDVWSAYERMDIVALCSRRESSSNTVLEAMAAGKPVVATRVGGLPELLGDGQWGLCVEPGNVPSLAYALHRLIESETLRKHLGDRAREVVRARHDPGIIGRQWLDLLMAVAHRRARRCSLTDEAWGREPVAVPQS